MSGEDRYVERAYRAVARPVGLTCYGVVIGESDLWVCTRGDLSALARRSLAGHRAGLEAYLGVHPAFGTSFRPVPAAGEAPAMVSDMARAAEAFGVGPMAAVAGAVAQHVGMDLLERSAEVIVENGGDLFLAGGGERAVRVFGGAGAPSFDVRVEAPAEGVGLCTSSAKVGPSVSLGRAEAVTVLARTATLADAAATAIGNRVRGADDIAGALAAAESHPDVMGAAVVAGGSVGVWRLVIVGDSPHS